MSAPPGQSTDAIRRPSSHSGSSRSRRRNSSGGVDWNTWIRSAIDNADVVVVVLPDSDAIALPRRVGYGS